MKKIIMLFSSLVITTSLLLADDIGQKRDRFNVMTLPSDIGDGNDPNAFAQLFLVQWGHPSCSDYQSAFRIVRKRMVAPRDAPRNPPTSSASARVSVIARPSRRAILHETPSRVLWLICRLFALIRQARGRSGELSRAMFARRDAARNPSASSASATG